ncbi:hypothetical protein TL16_g06982 [Triparma laevis f. inornata]|uniref:Uncharacterized protein n=1 Tax=Triparma laevis f. inornata TaxID=1714386 RepID=A0A9W7EFI6_9STRA|nr:hypothetical protein TL16_g06982 [Triparma laevis f. inornata]
MQTRTATTLSLLLLLLLFTNPAHSNNSADRPKISEDEDRQSISSSPPSSQTLNFVVKNLYTSFNSGQIAQLEHGVIEPLRSHFFVATVTPDQLTQNLLHSSIKQDSKYKELKELAERGSNNLEMLKDQIDAVKKEFKEGIKVERDNKDREYFWEIDGKEYKGRTVGPLVWAEGVQFVEVVLRMGEKGGEYIEKTIPVKSVRRGLGELNAHDRKKFFSAVEKLYKTPTEEGKILYGENYVGMEEVWLAHNLMAVDSSKLLAGGKADELDKSVLQLAASNSKVNHSYRRQINAADPDSWMEIDGSTTNWSLLSTSHNLLSNSPESNNVALKVDASENGILVEGNHDKVMSNFATFGVWFERAVQSVDPSVSLPYFDEDGELGGTDLLSSVWEETSSASR